ncbi:3-oxoacyl-[acyl-carrier-protein] reductase [Faecalicatena sp. Marseille-Q4148]|nr:3-oxoacyl-[acyl-carrier-protein] reductase [Faecalicatena sp. Marseille-Q4148]
MLTGKIAVVTGAARGIGRAIALALAEEGAEVVINYHHSEERSMAVKEEIEARGGKAAVMQCDVSDYESCEKFVSAVAEMYGHIDIWVNNAGITKDQLLMRMSEEAFDEVIETNLKGTFQCMRFVSRIMVKQRCGRIINLSSVVGIAGNAGQVNYAASKAGVIGMTKSAAKELAGRGITVNAVAPGFIETEMTSVLSEKVQEQAKNQIPLGHFGTPEDVASAVVFLASEQAKYITGQVLQVDGGMVM